MLARSVLLVAAVGAAWPARAQSRAHFDLSGAWTTGSGPEPTVRRATMSPPCNYTPEHWSIQQDGSRVRAWTTPPHRAQGIAIKDRSLPPAAVGRIDGVRLTMR